MGKELRVLLSYNYFTFQLKVHADAYLQHFLQGVLRLLHHSLREADNKDLLPLALR